jgi:hypothetical protein
VRGASRARACVTTLTLRMLITRAHSVHTLWRHMMTERLPDNGPLMRDALLDWLSTLFTLNELRVSTTTAAAAAYDPLSVSVRVCLLRGYTVTLLRPKSSSCVRRRRCCSTSLR